MARLKYPRYDIKRNHRIVEGTFFLKFWGLVKGAKKSSPEENFLRSVKVKIVATCFEPLILSKDRCKGSS